MSGIISRTGIDGIVSKIEDPKVEKGWVTVLQKFNPLGAVAEAYGRTLVYRLECKRIDAELERVKTQATVVLDSIDKTYKLKMEGLAQRRLSMNRFFDTVQGELGQHHLERMTVLKMAESVTMHMLAPNLSLEERQNCRALAAELTAQIPVFGDKANESLKTLFDALPQVSLPEHLLLSE